MTSWLTRHAECLRDASQALRKVQEDDKTLEAFLGDSSEPDRGSQRGSEQGPFRDDGRLEEGDEGAEDGWGHQREAWAERSTGAWYSKEFYPPVQRHSQSFLLGSYFFTAAACMPMSAQKFWQLSKVSSAPLQLAVPCKNGDDLIKRDRIKASNPFKWRRRR